VTPQTETQLIQTLQAIANHLASISQKLDGIKTVTSSLNDIASKPM